MKSDQTKKPPFETHELRVKLQEFLDTPFNDEQGVSIKKIGDFKYGVYAFFDYDEEPIYVGQTNEKVRTRIRRHLTNQRTDAVAMGVLDPFEVYKIRVWPLVEFDGVGESDSDAYKQACRYLNNLEFKVFQMAIEKSEFNAVLNEKEPPRPTEDIELPPSCDGVIVSTEVEKIRSHPDYRIARRASTLARLATVISERLVNDGLRKTLLVQAQRLSWLAERRYKSLSGK